MNGFKGQLDKELERRGLKDANSPPSSDQPTKIKQAKYFSFGSFFLAFSLGGIVLGALIGMSWLNAKETTEDSIGKLASKTAIVEETNGQVYSERKVTNVLKMPDATSPIQVPVEGNSKEDNKEEKQQETTVDTKPPSVVSKPTKAGALTPAPISGLYESGNFGLLPVIRESDNLTPFNAYKRPHLSAAKPVISFVVTDLGLSQKATKNIIGSLPADASLVFTPYGSDVKTLVKNARAEGHEVWLQLPLEAQNYPVVDTGPLTILKSANIKQNEERLNKVLSRFEGYAGVVAGKNHIFSTEDATINPVFKNMFERGLAIVDSNISLYSFVSDLAVKEKYPQTKNNFWLDEDLTPAALNQKIRQIMEYAKARGNVIVMTGPSPAAINAIKKFISSDTAKDFELVPLSSQVKFGE